jgi:hypothetical protein
MDAATKHKGDMRKGAARCVVWCQTNRASRFCVGVDKELTVG